MLTNKTINIVNKKDLVAFIIILLTFVINIPIPFFQSFSFISKIYKVFQMIFVVVALCHFRNVTSIMVAILCYYAIFIFATIVNGNSFSQVLQIIRAFVACFNLIVVSDYYMKNKSRLFFYSAKLFFFSIIIIELFTIMFYPNGLYETMNANPHYFLGHRNNTIEYILPGLLICGIDKILNRKSEHCTLYFVVSFLCVLLTWSANSMVSMFVFLLYFLLKSKKSFVMIFDYWSMFIMSALASFGIIILKVQHYFEWLIVGILNKSLDFTNRDMIWERALYFIKKSPIFGYGFEHYLVKASKIIHPNSCHNYYLDFLYSGGILMLTTIVVMVIMVGKKLKKVNENEKLNKISKGAIGVIIAYFVIWIATPIHLETIGYMFFVFFVAYNYEKIKINEEVNYEKI